MKSVESVLEEILIDIIPTERELKLIQDISNELSNILTTKANELGIKFTQMEPQGSTGIKQTQLRNNFDIDYFIGLDYNLYKHKYKGLTKNKLKKKSKQDFLDLCKTWLIPALNTNGFEKPELLYAEHPYVSVTYVMAKEKIKIDIVLYFDLDIDYIKENGPITAVDRSPWHGRFVKDNLDQQQKNDVRLLKQFFKANHSYGDKSALGKGGFIGYSSELLIYHFKSLLNTFQNFESLKDIPIDFYHRPLSQLKKITHFQKETLIIIDPIDKNRNVASAISNRAFNYCNQKIKDFLNKPDKEYFTFKPIEESDLIGIDNYYVVEFKQTKKDLHYTIIRDKLHSLADSIKANGEKELSHEMRFGKIISEIYFEDDKLEYNIVIFCEKSEISPTFIRKGPPIKEITHSEKFKKKNPDYFVKDGYLCVEEKRKHTEFIIFLKKFIQEKIPNGLDLINISNAIHSRSDSAKRAITVLKDMVLPYI